MTFTGHLFLISTLFVYFPNLYNGQKEKLKEENVLSGSFDEEIFGCDGELYDDNSTGARSGKQIIHNQKTLNKVPERFDARIKWPNCKSLQLINKQGKCGGCWAFASASVMSDRLCIATKGSFNRMVSAQDLMECCDRCFSDESRKGGCKGGWMFQAFEYWEKIGLVTGRHGCKPIDENTRKGNPVKICRSECTNREYKTPYSRDKSYGMTSLRSLADEIKIKHIQAEIMVNGPVVASIQSYTYIKLIEGRNILKFEPKKAIEKPRAHAIKLIGWDVIDGTPIWIIANSWGRRWCDGGFCYIRRGKNDFDLEENQIVAGIPKVAKNVIAKGGMRSGSSKIGCCGNFIIFLIFLNILFLFRIL